MALDPAILAYAFFESYLNRRENVEWKGLVKISDIDPATFQNDDKINPEIKQKIALCIDTIRNISRANTAKERIALTLELANKEEQEKKNAAEKGGRFLGFARLFVNPDPLLAQLLRALTGLYIEDIKNKPELAAHLAKLKKDNDNIKEPTALEIATAETQENALQREREKKAIAREIEILSTNNEFYNEFYNKWIKTDAKAVELKEETLAQCIENVKSNARTLDFCKKLSLAVANEKGAARPVAPVPAPVVAVPEVPKPVVVEKKEETIVVKPVVTAQVPVKIMVTLPKREAVTPAPVVQSAPATKPVSFTTKATPLAAQSKFAAKSQERPQPQPPHRERRTRHVKKDENFVYENPYPRNRF